VVSVYYLKIFEFNRGVWVEMLMLQAIIPYGRCYNFPMWYLSAMLFVEWIYASVLRCEKDLCYKLVAPMLAIIAYAGFFTSVGDLNVSSSQVFSGMTNGIVLALAGISTGVLLYYLNDTVQKKISRNISCILEILLSLIVIVAMIFGEGRNRFDFIILLLLGVLIFSAVHNDSALNCFLDGNWLKNVQDLSVNIYFNHAAIQYLVVCSFQGLTICEKMIAFFVLVFAESIVTNKLLYKKGKEKFD